MAKYEYEVAETRSEDVPNCPLCGYDDLKFWNYSRDCSMHGAAAGVKCKRCGHEVKVDGNDLHLEWGEDCQRAAIEEWKSQVIRWGKRNAEANPDVASLKKKLDATLEENNILKSVIALESFSTRLDMSDCRSGFDDLKRKFIQIMDKFVGSQGAKRKTKQRGSTTYRAKSASSRRWIAYTYGDIAGKPIEASTMTTLASSIAYYFRRHAVDLYVSEDGGETFKKADEKKQLEFSHVMDAAFRLDEWH